MRAIKLKETPLACPPGATIIDAEFKILRHSRRSRRKRSWFLLLVMMIFAAALGGMAGIFAPAAWAQVFS